MGSMDNAMKLRESSFAGDLKIFVRDVRDRQGRKRPVTVRSWATVKDVKDALQQQLSVPPSAQSLYFGPLMTSGGELPNHRTLHDAGIDRSGKTLFLDIHGGAFSNVQSDGSSLTSLRSTAHSDICVSSSFYDAAPKSLRRLVQQARRGFSLGLKPDLVLEGSGGTYFLHDARKVKVAVFKPADEEPYAQNNPRGYVRELTSSSDISDISLRAGIQPGEACLREVAAYALDHDGFSGVPMTTLVEARHPAFHTNGSRLSLNQGGAAVGAHSLNTMSPPSSPVEKKVGSFQAFARAECSMDDMSPTKISVDEVHKIAILDIRLMNADRNAANLLCARRPDNSLQLIPIDHGFCLRSVCDVAWFDWCWLDWPQLKKPLSKRSKEYILNLDLEADVRLLEEQLNIPKKGIEYFRASSKLLQAGVRAGLTLYDIATLCCRHDDAGEVPSRLESLVKMAAELATSAVENGRWHHAAASRALEEQLIPDRLTLVLPPMHKKLSASSKLFRSVSSTHFSSLANESETEQRSKRSPPQMMLTASSGSDSGSEVFDVVEHGDCEEWAASVIADVGMDQPAPTGLFRSESSVSVSSTDSMLSSSPKGFWHIHPSSRENVEEDQTWSPISSPRRSPANSMFDSRRNSSNSRKNMDDIEESEADRCTPGVTFDPASLIPPPSALNDALNRRMSLENNAKMAFTPAGQKIPRSQSYSAFSFRTSSYVSDAVADANDMLERDVEHYREYLTKFVDLLIERELLSASRKRESKSDSFSNNNSVTQEIAHASETTDDHILVYG